MAGGQLRHAKRQARRALNGQGMVEFALVGSLFFFLIFSIMNAGFFLYGRNAIENAADIGVATIAAEGNATGGDTVAFQRMDAVGLATTPMITITEVDLYKETQSSSGTLSDAYTCGTGAQLCENIYDAYGNATQTRWASASRNVGDSPDFARLVIQYKYKTFVANTTFTLSTNNSFRLEPQT